MDALDFVLHFSSISPRRSRARPRARATGNTRPSGSRRPPQPVPVPPPPRARGGPPGTPPARSPRLTPAFSALFDSVSSGHLHADAGNRVRRIRQGLGARLLGHVEQLSTRQF